TDHTPPTSTLFPYTTLFRSQQPVQADAARGHLRRQHGGAAGRATARLESQGDAAGLPRAPPRGGDAAHALRPARGDEEGAHPGGDRKSTRLNSSHLGISYAV